MGSLDSRGGVNNAETDMGGAALCTLGLASRNCRGSGQVICFWLLQLHSSSVSGIDLFTCKS